MASRAFSPERSPESRATKSVALTEPSTRSPRQSNCPVAAKEREIEGQASDRSMSPSVSEVLLCASSYFSTPSWMRISENDTWFSAPGFMVLAMVSTNGVQLLSPLPSRTTRMVGRSIITSEISNRRSSSGSSRRFAVSTSTCSAGSAVAPALQADVMEGDVARRKHRNVDRALDDEIEPGDGADLRLDRLLQRVAVEEPGRRDQAEHGHAEELPQSASRGASFLGPSSMP